MTSKKAKLESKGRKLIKREYMIWAMPEQFGQEYSVAPGVRSTSLRGW